MGKKEKKSLKRSATTKSTEVEVQEVSKPEVQVVPESEPAKKKKKKDKKEKTTETVEVTPVAAATPTEDTTVTVEKKSKKEKKEKKEKTESEKTTSTTVAVNKESSNSDEDHSSHPWYKENNVTITGSPAPKPSQSFQESPLPRLLRDYLDKKFGKESKPSLIQGAAWPLIQSGKDVFGIAKTGSGKSLAFLLPYLAKRYEEIVNNCDIKTKKHYPRALVLAPTKELVQQIHEVCVEFGKVLKIPGLDDGNAAHCIIGGLPKWNQINRIKEHKCEICIATPGRLLDLVENDEVLNLSRVEYFVLDEADRMLDDGFILSIRKIAEFIAAGSDGLDSNKDTKSIEKQTVLFSATWPIEVNKLARGLVDMLRKKSISNSNVKKSEPAVITVLRKGENASDCVDAEGNINTEDRLQLNDAITQKVYVMEDGKRKWNLLLETLRSKENKNKKTLIFGLYKKEVSELEEWLRGTNNDEFKIVALQGDMTQEKRSKALDDFKKNHVRTLVATDVAGRGLDISDIELVVNYTFPLTVEDFVHRCGRTGRAGKKGRAVTFFNKSGLHKEKEHCFNLIRLLEGAKQEVPSELKKLDSQTFTATKKKSHGMYGNFFKSEEEMAALSQKKVQISFDSDSD